MNTISMANPEEYKKATENGTPAEMEVWGVLRGGWSFDGKFFYTRGRYQNVVISKSGKLPVKILN